MYDKSIAESIKDKVDLKGKLLVEEHLNHITNDHIQKYYYVSRGERKVHIKEQKAKGWHIDEGMCKLKERLYGNLREEDSSIMVYVAIYCKDIEVSSKSIVD